MGSALVAAWAIAQSDWNVADDAKSMSGLSAGVSDDLRRVLDSCISNATLDAGVGNGVAGNKNTIRQLTAVELLASGFPEGRVDVSRLIHFIDPSFSPQVQCMAVDAVGSLNEQGSQALIENLPNQTPTLQARSIDWLLQRANSVRGLLTVMESGEIDIRFLASHQRDRLLSHGDKAIRVRAERLLGARDSDKSAVIAAYRKALREEAAPDSSVAKKVEQGRAVYVRVCAACHRVDGEGSEVGPDLLSVLHRDDDYFLQAILDPDATIESRFRQIQVLTTDGRLIAGIKTAEDDDWIEIIQTQGKVDRVAREEIDAIQPMAVSMMTSGLQRDMTPKELGDLISFLRSKK